jgi:hypothetical protein
VKTYKSKFGFEIIVFLTALFGGMIMFIYYQNEPIETIVSVGGISLIVYALCLYLNASTKYTIKEEGVLNVKCGFLYNKDFDISTIKSVAKTNSIISSPAPSMDRIEIIFGKFDVLVISPNDKNAFVKELKRVNPQIENRLIN